MRNQTGASCFPTKKHRDDLKSGTCVALFLFLFVGLWRPLLARVFLRVTGAKGGKRGRAYRLSAPVGLSHSFRNTVLAHGKNTKGKRQRSKVNNRRSGKSSTLSGLIATRSSLRPRLTRKSRLRASSP